jgi:hypothetical protein
MYLRHIANIHHYGAVLYLKACGQSPVKCRIRTRNSEVERGPVAHVRSSDKLMRSISELHSARETYPSLLGKESAHTATLYIINLR